METTNSSEVGAWSSQRKKLPHEAVSRIFNRKGPSDMPGSSPDVFAAAGPVTKGRGCRQTLQRTERTGKHEERGFCAANEVKGQALMFEGGLLKEEDVIDLVHPS